MRKRIWELDALRGLCLLGVIAVHLIFDLTVMYRIIDWDYPDWFNFVQRWGGTVFLVLSGTCVTLGHHPIRRGIIVFGAGMLITGVTWGMYKLGFAGNSMVIRFGVLHCLGICMLLWPLLRKCPWWVLAILGAAFIALGFYVAPMKVDCQWLFPLGLKYPGFASGDYFPLFPQLGFFLLGAVIGKTAYAKKQTLLPKINARIFPFNALQFLGRHSLEVYLLHQPILAGMCCLLTLSR